MKALLLHLSAMVVIAIIIVFSIFYVYLPSITHHNEEITVPDLRGMTVGEADKVLRNAGLNYLLFDTISLDEDKYEPWAIVNQFPKPGSTVKPGRSLRLTLQNDKRPMVNLPNVIDGSINNAQTVLKAKRLELGEITYVDSAGRAVVLKMIVNGEELTKDDFANEQTPIRVQTGTRVDLIVANGLDDQELPYMIKVEGLSLEQAKVQLIGWGLLVGRVEEKPAFAPKGIVIYQNPEPDAQKVRAGQMVRLIVSAGPDGLPDSVKQRRNRPQMPTPAEDLPEAEADSLR